MIATPRRTAQKFLEAELQREERKRIEEEERKGILLADPAKLDKLVADIAVNLAPKVAKPRYAKYGTRVEAVDAKAKGTPMKGFAGALRMNITKALEAPEMQGAPARTVVAAVTDLMMKIPGPEGRSRLEETHLYKWRADTAFGAFGEDTSVRALPGYEEYLAERMAEPSEAKWTHPAVSAAVGGGASAAWIGAKHGLARAGMKWAAGRLAAAKAGAILGPKGAIVAGALTAIPAFAAFDAVEKVLEKSEWGRARRGTVRRFAVEAVAGLGTYYGASKVAMKALKIAVGKEILSDQAIAILRKLPTAARVIDAAKAKKAADAAIAEVRTEVARIAPLKRTKVGLYEALSDPSEVALEEALKAAGKGRGLAPSLVEELRIGVGRRAEEGRKLIDILRQRRVTKAEVEGMVGGLKAAAVRKKARREVAAMTEGLEALGWKIPKKVDPKKAFTGLSDEMTEVAIKKSEEVGIKQASLEAKEMGEVLKKGTAKSIADEKAGGSLGRLAKKAEKKRVKKVKEPPAYIAKEVEEEVEAAVKKPGVELIKERTELFKAQKREAELKLLISEQTTEMTVEAELARKHYTKGLTKGEKEEKFYRHDFDVVDMLKSIALMVGTGSVFSVLSPDDAEAGVLHDAALKIPKVVIPIIKKAKDPKKMVMEMAKAKYFVLPIDPSHPKILPDFARTIDSARAFTETGKKLNQIITRTKAMIPGGARWGAPNLINDTMYKTGYGPAPQLAHMQTNAWGHIENATTVMTSILGPEYRSQSRMLIDTMKPLAERYAGDVGAYTALEFKVGRQKEALDKLWKGLVKTRKKPSVRKELGRIKAIEVLEGKIAKNEAARVRVEPAFRKYLAEWEATVQPLAREHSTVRISLAAEDTVDYKHYPWLRDIMTTEEKVAVEYIKDLHESYAIRILEAGGDVITTRPYVHHAFHPSWTEAAARKRLGELGVDIGDTIPYSKFFRRTKHSRQMVPDIAYNMQKYIPDAERRCGWMEFWRRKDKDGWYAHSHSHIVRDSEELSRYWRQIRKGAVPAADTPLNRFANRYSAFEVLRLIGWAPAPALKHFLKNIGTWSIFGFKQAGTHLLPAQAIAYRNQVNSPVGQKFLNRLGLKGGTRKKFMDDVVKASTNQGRMLNVIADLEADVLINRTGIMGQFDKWLLRLNRSGSIPIRMIEAGDRAHSFLMAVDMAAKKGMTAQQAMYGVYSTILRCNFLSGNLNPVWMRNPKTRALTLFQNTVFKIAERRLVTAVRAGKSVKLAFGVVKKEGVGQVLKELRELGRYMQGAEREFKQHLIFDALTSEKNVFGSPILSEFMRELLLAGIIIGGGSAVGLDLHAHVHHLPFFRIDRADPTLAMNPALNSYFQFREERKEAEKYDEDKEFFINHFLRRYISSTGPMPRTMTKILRISDEDVPEVYKGSKWQYMFSIPTKGED